MKERILVVEDSATQAEQVRLMLEAAGYEVCLAADGEQALSRIQALPPDLILSDVVMPVMDGYALCSAVKSDERISHVPFVMLTSQPEGGDKTRALEAGADDFLAKPVERAELIARARSLLRVKRLHDELNRANAELRQLTAELEDRVAVRTAELQARTEEVAATTQQLWQAAKLATMGELTASIAHELNNPLAIVSLRVEGLVSQLADDDPKRASLDVIDGEIRRMADLVANLLQSSRRSVAQISTLDVREELSRSLDLVQHHLRSRGVTVATEFSDQCPHIHADRQQLRQVFLNLITNGSDAMPEGGTLTVRVGPAPDQSIGIEFVDTGVGIEPELMAKVFDPFFTTKPEGKGSGLGLPICQRIVEEHKGKLVVTSEPHVGTTVGIILPVADSTNATYL